MKLVLCINKSSYLARMFKNGAIELWFAATPLLPRFVTTFLARPRFLLRVITIPIAVVVQTLNTEVIFDLVCLVVDLVVLCGLDSLFNIATIILDNQQFRGL